MKTTIAEVTEKTPHTQMVPNLLVFWEKSEAGTEKSHLVRPAETIINTLYHGFIFFSMNGRFAPYVKNNKIIVKSALREQEGIRLLEL